MEKMLELILQKIDGLGAKVDSLEAKVGGLEAKVDGMQAQIDENTQIIKAIHHRQEETDAKLDNIAMDVHKLHGEVATLKDGQALIKKEVKGIKDELIYTAYRTDRNEREIFHLKRDQYIGHDEA